MMKRMHIHIAVEELSKSIDFYSTMFGAEPTVEHDDYAKWKLNDPAVNFAISSRGQTSGLNHLGIQVDTETELEELSQRLDAAEMAAEKQQGAACCYAKSDKHWVLDPQGIAWESFYTLDNIPTFGDDTITTPGSDPDACCIPAEGVTSGCCS
jgi:catechol 2,3-dioxygenase-like lactoylglutathione lyase family enzyme